MRKLTNRKGFTLIELVMVIVILGILAAVALPTFFNLQEDAKRSVVKGNLGGLRSGISIWYAKTATSGAASFPNVGQLTSSPGGVMQFGIPVNPYTNSSKVILGSVEGVNSSAGWIYNDSLGLIWSSAAETQNSGY